jgi:hypothetical protein
MPQSEVGFWNMNIIPATEMETLHLGLRTENGDFLESAYNNYD